MRAVEKIKLNLVPGGSPGGILPRVRVSQGDAQDRILQFEVYDGNEAASLSGIVSCYIGGTKPDGNGFTVDCTKNTNIVTAVLTDQATVLPGNIRCKLYLLSSTGSVRSASFELDVDPDPLADAGTSDTDITAIVQAAAMYAREAGEAAATAVSSAWDAMGASWEENHEYTVDDMVVFGQDDGGQGHIYKCILTHTSSDAILPTDTTYWEDTTLCAQISSLNSNLANKSKIKVQNGTVTVTGAGTGSWTYKAVTFGIPYKTTPLVVVTAPCDTASGTDWYMPMIRKVKTTGFEYGWFNISNTKQVLWQAVGEI